MSVVNEKIRCSVIVFSGENVLLMHRPDRKDWVLPGGTPRPGETLLACARRELHEETGMLAHPGLCALIVESVPPDGKRIIDVVFLAPELPVDTPQHREQPLEPRFVPLARLDSCTVHPPITSYLKKLHARRRPPNAPHFVRHEWLSPATHMV